MQTEKNKKIGLLILITGTIGFFLFSYFFHLFGSKVEFKNPFYLLKMIFTDSFLLGGLYFGLYFANGKKIAGQISGALLLFLVIAFIVGFFRFG
jgi:hypothetical protein